MTKPNYNERKALKTVLTKWAFDVVEASDLNRGDIIIENGQYRQVAATMSHLPAPAIPGEPPGSTVSVSLAFEEDPYIETTDADRMIIRVNVTRKE